MLTPTLSELPPPPAGKAGWPWTRESPPLPPKMSGGKPWPKISIVTPSYNQVEFIEETIRSVLLQGYPNLEYVIIDGGSTDGSVEVIEKYEPWLSYWVSERDRGQSHAINKGFARSTGEIMAWLNSDDMYVVGALARIARALVNPGRGFIYGRALWMHPGGEFTLEKLRTPNPELDFLENWIAQPTAFWKRDVWEKAGPLDESLDICMDLDFWLKVKNAGIETVGINSPLAIFRVHPGSKTFSPSGKWNGEKCRVFKRHARGLKCGVMAVYLVTYSLFKILSVLGNGPYARRMRRYATLATLAPLIPAYGIDKLRFLYRSFYMHSPEYVQ